ncbi:MAG: adenylate/guanylate cyclase domain-containing protein [Roseiarcus sp.]
MLTSTLPEWLKLHGLDRFTSLFEQNEVDLQTLRLLTDDDLKELGLPFGPRKRILSLLGEERQLEKSSPPSSGGAPVGERRQLTVLFCDMVGFTKLAHRLDPETLQVVVRAYEDACTTCVNRYDGYVFTTLGDGIVAFFGYPLAHEGEAERAVRAGLDIIDVLAALQIRDAGRLQVRIGIATGMVVVATGERNAVGETMNLASRLQTIAKPGTVIVSERVRRLAEGLFEYEDLGERELKGVNAPTRVYRVVGVTEAESRFDAAAQRGLTPLVGRDNEVGTLLDAWKSVRGGGGGQIVVLRGEAGIGKSRIVDTLRERLGQAVGRTLLFQGSPFFVSSAFYPMRTWFERTLGLAQEEDADGRLDKLEALMVDKLGLARDDLRFVAAMLSIPFHDRYGAILISPKLAREDTMRTLVEVVRAQARLEPTLVLFEDAHWADPSTLDVFARIVDKLADIPALVVVTARPEFKPPWKPGPGVSDIQLAKFTPMQSRSLLEKVAGGKALPDGLAAQIIARTDGVPLFVEELTKTILESGDLIVEGDHFAYAGSAANVSIPETLRDSLMARLDRVPAAKEIAQVGSVIGREFMYELIAGLDLMSEESLGMALRLLTAAGIATSRGDIPSAVYAFSHALVQDAAYDSILKSRRKQLHGEIARLLNERWPETRDAAPELLAYHHSAAEQHSLAAPLWLRAGEIAIQRFALSEGIAHLRTGMSTLTKFRPSKTRDLMELSLRTALGPALVAQRGWAHSEVSEVLEPAWKRAQARKHLPAYLPILSSLAVHYMSAGALKESLRRADELLKAAKESGDDSMEIVGHRSAVATLYWSGDFLAARRAGDRVHELYDAERHWRLALLTNSDPFTGEGIYRSQFLWILGYPDQARAANEATEANARRRDHPFDLAFALTLGAQLHGYLHEYDALFRRSQEAERIGKEHGITLLGEIMAEITRGIAWLGAGHTEDGAQQLGEAIELLRQTGHRIWIWYLRALQAEGLAKIGDLDQATALIEESVARIEEGEERAHHAEVLRLHGWLQIKKGQPKTAEATLRKAIEVARGQQAKSWELRAATTLARLLADRGDRDEAVAVLKPVHDWFTEGLQTKDYLESSRLLDELTRVTS